MQDQNWLTWDAAREAYFAAERRFEDAQRALAAASEEWDADPEDPETEARYHVAEVGLDEATRIYGEAEDAFDEACLPFVGAS